MSTTRKSTGADGRQKLHLMVDFRTLYFNDCEDSDFNNKELELAYEIISYHRNQGSSKNGMTAYLNEVMNTSRTLDGALTYYVGKIAESKYIAANYNLTDYKSYFNFCSEPKNKIDISKPKIGVKEFIFIEGSQYMETFDKLDKLNMKAKVSLIINKTLAHEYYGAYKGRGEHNYFLHYATAQTLNWLIDIYQTKGESELFYTFINAMLNALTITSIPIIKEGKIVGFESINS